MSILKAAGLPKTSFKFTKAIKAPSIKIASIKAPKFSAPKSFKSFDTSKITKGIKLPKVTKLKVMKLAIKKNAGF